MTNTQSAKIDAVSFSGFRGQRSSTILNLGGDSMIVLGPNGSGKSTIADAIEFATQGRIGRTRAFQSELTPCPVNVGGDGVARCDVLLTDGTEIGRTVRRDENPETGEPHFQVSRRGTHDRRWYAPIGLKRADILRFTQTPSAERGKVFFDVYLGSRHLGDVQPGEKTATEEEAELRTLLSGSATRLGDARAELALVGQISVGTIPESLHRFESWQERHINQRQALAGGEEVIGGHLELTTICEAISLQLHNRAEIRSRLKALKASDLQENIASLTGVLGDVGDRLTEGFSNIYDHHGIDRIEVDFGRSSAVSIDIEVITATGIRVTPQEIFSEGLQDLTAFLFFLSVAKAAGEAGQLPILLLDDVIQSVDGSVRVALMDYIIREFKEWQLIITTHEQQWQEHVAHLFQRARGQAISSTTLGAWSQDEGLRILPQKNFSVIGCRDRDELEKLILNDESPGLVAIKAGIVLEQACEELTFSLSPKMHRRRQYSLEERWNAVRKVLQKSPLADLLGSIDRQLMVRNSLGAHWNDWAVATPAHDVTEFGSAVLEFFDRTYCLRCTTWIAGSETRCRCGVTALASNHPE